MVVRYDDRVNDHPGDDQRDGWQVRAVNDGIENCATPTASGPAVKTPARIGKVRHISPNDSRSRVAIKTGFRIDRYNLLSVASESRRLLPDGRRELVEFAPEQHQRVVERHNPLE